MKANDGSVGVTVAVVMVVGGAVRVVVGVEGEGEGEGDLLLAPCIAKDGHDVPSPDPGLYRQG